MRPLAFFIFIATVFSSCLQHSRDPIQNADFDVEPKKTLDYLNEMAEGADKDNPSIFYQRANIYFKLQDFEKANKDITKAISLKTAEPAYFVLKGKIEQQLNQPERAIESLLVAEKLGARDERLYEILATEYLQLNEVTKAKAAVDRLVKTQSGAGSYALQGDVFLAIGDSSDAIKSYKKAIGQEPPLKRVYLQLTTIYNQRQLYEETGQLLNRYLEADSSDSDILLQKGRLLNQMSAYDSAKQVYKRLLRQDSSSSILFYELSDIFYAANSFDSAAHFAQKAYNLNADLDRAQITLARSLDKLRKYQEAIDVYESILKADSTHNIASQELDNLKRKVAYLWQLEQQRKKQDSMKSNLPPTIEKKEIEN